MKYKDLKTILDLYLDDDDELNLRVRFDVSKLSEEDAKEVERIVDSKRVS